ncbi:MAG: SLBB domain-containing protein [Bacteroidaceae bacterium]
MKRLVLWAFLICVSTLSFAQSASMLSSLAGMSLNSIDKISDTQMEQIVGQMDASGITTDNLELQGSKFGLSKDQVSRLKKRIVRYNGVTEEEYKSKKTTKASEELDKDGNPINQEDKDGKNKDSKQKLEVFGLSTFRDANLTFEPNLRIATPSNYMLGPDDELLIDIYGTSQASYNLFVSPEGKINIPYVGVVTIGGLTIEEAKSVLTKRLSKVYAGLSSGAVKVSIAVGDIRSITVSVIGEVVSPGSYTLPSLSSVYNALYLSGGPTENASFRKVQISRGNKIISVIDLYDFLVYGKSSTLCLRDNDVIKVMPYQNRVSITGEVKTPAIFEMNEFESVANLIEFAGGFSQNAYRDRITAYRNTNKERSVIDVPSANYKTFMTESGDEYQVGILLDRFSNRVQIQGSVYRPGEYALDEGMRVSDLLKKADGLLNDAFITRAIIYRKSKLNLPEIASFSPRDVLAGQNDVLLQREDSVHIFSVLDMKEKEFIYVAGAVVKPGSYAFGKGMKLKDAVLMANGFNSSADVNEIEVYRQLIDEDNLKDGKQKAEKFKFKIDHDLSFNDETSNFLLQKNDRVIIRSQYGLEEMKKVSVVGEVKFPGDYVLLSKEQRLSDLIEMAGGLTNYAYPDGAFLIRKRNLSDAEKRMLSQLADQLGSKITTKGNERDSLETRKSLIRETDLVGIDLNKALHNPGSRYDLLISAGDSISIPQKLELVYVDGEVMHSNAVSYKKGQSLNKYIKESGGYSAKAWKKGSYVVHANGSVDATSSFLGIKSYPRILPGSRIVIPEKPIKQKMTTAETIGVSTSLVSVAAIIVSLFK